MERDQALDGPKTPQLYVLGRSDPPARWLDQEIRTVATTEYQNYVKQIQDDIRRRARMKDILKCTDADLDQIIEDATQEKDKRRRERIAKLYTPGMVINTGAGQGCVLAMHPDLMRRGHEDKVYFVHDLKIYADTRENILRMNS